MRFPDPITLTAYREAVGGRRFWLTLGCGLVNTGLVAWGKIPSDVYRDIILATVATYIAGGTYQAVKGAQNVSPT